MQTTLPKATDLLKQSWQMFKQKVKILILIELVSFLGAIPFVILFGATGLMGSSGAKASALVFFPIIIALVIFALTLQLWAQTAIIFTIDSSEPVLNFKDLFRRARPFIISYLWVSILVGLIVFGGFILLIIPGIIFAFWYCLSTYTVVLEGQRGMEALRTSKSYVKGNIGQIFAKGVFLIIVALVVYGIPSIIFDGIGLKGLSNIYRGVAGVVFSPLATIYFYLIYRGLRDAKAGSENFTPPQFPSLEGRG